MICVLLPVGLLIPHGRMFSKVSMLSEVCYTTGDSRVLLDGDITITMQGFMLVEHGLYRRAKLE